ncbi:hypothetical protein Tco_0566689 [Tanacetum coccineum]
MGMDPMIKLQRKSKKSCLSENVRALAKVGPLSGKDPLVIVVVDTDCLSHVCYGSALSAYVLKYLGRSELIPGLSGSSHYHINLSQLSVIATAKVCHFKILCRVHCIEPTVGLFRCFHVNSKDKGWMSFSKRPNSDAFADDYTVLVAHPAPFQKFPEPFLCLVGISHYYTLDEDTYPSFLHDDETDMDLFAFIQVVNPTKMRVVGRKRAEGEEKLLDFTIRRVVLLLPVAPAHAKSELEAGVDRLFDDGGSTKQGDSATGGGHDADIELVTATKNVAVVTAERPIRHHKKKQAVKDASGSSHPPKKLKGDYGTSSGAATGGKSPSVLKELLVSSIMNVKVSVEAVVTLPLVTSSVSTMPGHEGGHPSDSITEINLRIIGASERFVISSDSSHHSSAYASEAEVDSIIRSDVLPLVMTEAIVTSHAINAPSVMVLEMGTKITSPVHTFMFHDSDSTETVKADAVGPSYSAKQDLSMGSREMNAKTLHQEFVDHLAPPALFSQICEMDYHYLFTKFNVGTARQACLNADRIENLKAQLLLKETKVTEAIRLRNVVLENERDSLNRKILELQSSVSAKDLELKEVNVAASSLKSQNNGLVDQVHALETTCFSLHDQFSGYEQLKEQVKEFQDAQMNIVSDKVAKLDANFLEMALHLEEKFYPHLFTTISGRRWLLTHGVRLSVVKCINSSEYLTALGSAISRSIKKGMQDGLSADINHGKTSRSLADVVAYNPAAKADYNSALVQRLREIKWFLVRPLCHFLCVAHSRVEKIRENVAAQRSALIDVWVSLVDPLSAKNLIGTTSTSDSVPAAIVTTTALSTTFASASSVPPITTDDYDIVNVDGQEDAQGNVASFPTVEFEKE